MSESQGEEDDEEMARDDVETETTDAVLMEEIETPVETQVTETNSVPQIQEVLETNEASEVKPDDGQSKVEETAPKAEKEGNCYW